MSFAETRLDLGIDYNTRGSLRYSTSIIVDGVGNEQRNANWGQPLGRWLLGDRTLSRRDLDYFLKFHAARKGARHGFRFKDWADYKGLRQPIGIGDGTTRQFQLTKTYTVGSSSVKRPILKPVGGTIKIYLNRIEHLDDWTIDVTQGIVTFNAAPDNDTVITADFEFDVPVRFEQDRIEFRFDAYDSFGSDAIFYLANLSCVELRLLPTIPIAPDLIGSMSEEILNLGYDYGTLGGPTYDTTITSVGANYEARVDNWETSRGRWLLGERTLTRAFLNYLIAFFRVVRGAANGFNYQDWQRERSILVRLETDSIEFRFDAADPVSGEAIFYLAGLSIVEVQEGIEAVLFQREHIENFIFTGPINDVLYTYTFTSTNPMVPENASIYLLDGYFDSEGTLGTFDTGETPDDLVYVVYNRPPDPRSRYLEGPPILIGHGRSVNGTVIEDEIDSGPEIFAAVEARLKFVWFS